MNEKSAICPLFNFDVSYNLAGNFTDKEIIKNPKTFEERHLEGFELFKSAKIRRITKEELGEIRKYHLSIGSSLPDISQFIISSIYAETFVLELSYNSKQMNGIKEIVLPINKVLLALRLYKEGYVFCKYLWFKNDAGLGQPLILNFQIPDNIMDPAYCYSFQYTIFPDDYRSLLVEALPTPQNLDHIK